MMKIKLSHIPLYERLSRQLFWPLLVIALIIMLNLESLSIDFATLMPLSILFVWAALHARLIKYYIYYIELNNSDVVIKYSKWGKEYHEQTKVESINVRISFLVSITKIRSLKINCNGYKIKQYNNFDWNIDLMKEVVDKIKEAQKEARQKELSG